MPTELVFKRDEVTPVREKLADDKEVVVADVPVAVVKVKLVKVEDAVERKPFKKARVVEVAFSLVESLVHGKAKLMEAR